MKRSKQPLTPRSQTPSEKRHKSDQATMPAKVQTRAKAKDSPSKSPKSKVTPVPMRDDGREPADVARDKRLRSELQKDTSDSPGDRHRHRLTAIEPEEDGATENDDDEREEADMRRQALAQQDADDDKDEAEKPA